MLTVLAATRNRAPSLGPVLTAFAALRPPSGGWRLVIVDNGSTDATQDALAAFADRLPLVVLHCARPGMNAALNVGVGAMIGDLLVKTDDDVLPDPGWLVAYRDATDRERASGLFGGTVEPEFPTPPPAWLDDHAASHSVLYAACRRADGPCPIPDIYGPNWAIRADLLGGPAPFNEAFGPDATKKDYAMGGETELFTRLAASGVAGYFVRDALVRHLIRPEQMTETWILRRAYRYGRGSGVLLPPDCARGAGLPGFGGVTPALAVRLGCYALAARAARLLPMSRRRLALRYRARYLAGVAAALRHASA